MTATPRCNANARRSSCVTPMLVINSDSISTTLMSFFQAHQIARFGAVGAPVNGFEQNGVLRIRYRWCRCRILPGYKGNRSQLIPASAQCTGEQAERCRDRFHNQVRNELERHRPQLELRVIDGATDGQDGVVHIHVRQLHDAANGQVG